MSLRPIEFKSLQDILATKDELDHSSYNNLIIATNGLSYTIPSVANLTSDELNNSGLKFLVKNGKNLTLREVHHAIKNKSSALNNLLKNTKLAHSIQNLKNHQVEKCAIDKQQLVYPAVTRCGHMMEYGSLSHWLFNHSQCPVCAKELDVSGFVRNKSLQQLNQIMFMRRQLRLSKIDNDTYKNLKKEEFKELRNRVNSIPTVNVNLDELETKHSKIQEFELKPKLQNLTHEQLDSGIEKYEFRQKVYGYRGNFITAHLTVNGLIFMLGISLSTAIACFALTVMWPLALGVLGMAALSLTFMLLNKTIFPEPKSNYTAKIERNNLLKQKNVVQEKLFFYRSLPHIQKEMRCEYSTTKLFQPKKKLKKAPLADMNVKNDDSHPDCTTRRIS